jgi:hypothetical protein
MNLVVSPRKIFIQRGKFLGFSDNLNWNAAILSLLSLMKPAVSPRKIFIRGCYKEIKLFMKICAGRHNHTQGRQQEDHSAQTERWVN